MLHRGYVAGWVVLWATVVVGATPPEPLLNGPGLLVGEWEATGGMLVQVNLLANNTAIVTGGKLANGQEAGMRLGTYKATGRGIWSVDIRDDLERAYNFSIVLRRADALTVFDGKGNQATLQRVQVSFDKLDKNKDGIITEDEIDDPVMVRRLYQWTSHGGHQLDRQQFARFIEKEALRRAGN